MTAPEIETKVRAFTTTATAQRVVILVTKIDEETDTGWFVYGYRQGGRNAGRRQTTYPGLYFVAK